MDFADEKREAAQAPLGANRPHSASRPPAAVQATTILFDRLGRSDPNEAVKPFVGNKREAIEARIRLDERGRLARELHDSTSQLLVALDLQLARLQRSESAAKSPVFDEVLAELHATVTELHKEVRAVGSSEHDPTALTRDLTAMASEFAARTGLVVRTEIENLPAGSSPELAHTLYRVAQEALANVSRHARASSVNLTLGTMDNSVELRIADDGVGFEGAPSSESAGRGISNMQVRLAEVGGALTISRGDPGAVVSAFVGMSPAAAD